MKILAVALTLVATLAVCQGKIDMGANRCRNLAATDSFSPGIRVLRAFA